MSSPLPAPCDVTSAQCIASISGQRHPRLILATTILASSLAFVDGSVVNVGLPSIGKSLGAETAQLQWIINAYLLPLSALILLGGAAGDRFGRRNILILGVGLFSAASLACAAAPTATLMLCGRFAQGVGAAMLMPNSLAILGQTFSGAPKGRAIGIWAGTGAVAGAVGPVLGGWLIDLGSWRAIFLINVPLAAIAIFLAARFVPGDEHRKHVPLDIIGALLATIALCLLTWGLTEGSAPGGWSPLALGFLAGGVLLLAALFAFEKKLGATAMMPVAMFGSRSFVGLSVLTLLLYGALGGLLVLLPYVLMVAGHYPATAAGAALLPLPLILSVTSPLIGSLTGRIGTRLPLAVGPIGVALGLLLATRISDSQAYWSHVFPAVVVVALGLSCAVAPLTTAVLNAVDDRHMGSASGFNSALARTGGLIATALIGTVLAEKGPTLLAAFRWAVMAGAVACVVASVSIVFLNRT